MKDMKVMKKILLFVLPFSLLFLLGAITKDTAYQGYKNLSAAMSPYQALMASGTANEGTAVLMGTLYGEGYTITIGTNATDADGFTVTIYEIPKSTSGTVTWPSGAPITKFTKLAIPTTTSSVEYGLETTTINSNVAVGATFRGDVYVTVTDYEGSDGTWYVSLSNTKASKSDN